MPTDAATRSVNDEKAQALAADAGLAEQLRQSSTVEAALARCDVVGGTARHRVASELEAAELRLSA